MLALGLVFGPAAGALTISGPSDCDNNAIVRCGVHSTDAVIDAYRASGYVQQVYAHFGITAADIANLPNTDVSGRVTKDGRVFVDGQAQAVATGAVTGGRQNIPGSTKVPIQNGPPLFKRPPSVSFQQDSLPAFVSMKNGVFQFAVIASCGNAVQAAPTTQPKPPQKAAVAPARPVSTPKPQQKPAPAQVQAQTQSQNVEQNVSQNQEVTVNNTTTPETTQETPAASEETAASTPAQPSETTPSTLPNTGSSGGTTIGIFSVSTILGALGFRRYLLHILGS